MKEKICIIDHYFHKKTNPFQFLIDILSKDYDPDIYWDYAPAGGSRVSLNIINKYETVLFFQVLNPIDELKKIKGKIIWMPMYDGLETNNAWWHKLSVIPLKILCFCKRLYDRVGGFGFDAIYLQYYKNPVEFAKVTDFSSKRVFFWQRGNIPLKTVLALLGENRIDSLDLMLVPDPYYKISLPKEEIIKKYNIRLYNEFLARKDYLSVAARNNIYIAPRKQEGIGMAFLEALAMGHCVIAYNDATMNEYLKNGHNSILFDSKKLEQVELADFANIAARGKDTATAGWQKWDKEKETTLDFIKTDFGKARQKKTFFYFNYFKKYLLMDIFYLIKELPAMVLGFLFSRNLLHNKKFLLKKRG